MCILFSKQQISNYFSDELLRVFFRLSVSSISDFFCSNPIFFFSSFVCYLLIQFLFYSPLFFRFLKMSKSQDMARSWSSNHNPLRSRDHESKDPFAPRHFRLKIGESNLELIRFQFQVPFEFWSQGIRSMIPQRVGSTSMRSAFMPV